MNMHPQRHPREVLICRQCPHGLDELCDVPAPPSPQAQRVMQVAAAIHRAVTGHTRLLTRVETGGHGSRSMIEETEEESA